MNSRPGSAANGQQQPIRNVSMNAYGSQAARQGSGPRLQNTQKSGAGNGIGASGWGMGGGVSGFGAAAAPGGLAGVGATQPRPGLSGFAQVMGGGSGQAPIDMSDFPSLSGGPGGPRVQQAQQASSAAASWNANTIRQQNIPQQAAPQPPPQGSPSAASSQQANEPFEAQRPAQQQSSERTGDEFPPLGGQANGDSHNNGFGSGLVSPEANHPRLNGQQTQLPIREVSGSSTIGTQPQPQAAPNGQPPPPAAAVKKYADMTESEQWSLPGLLAAFEARRQMESGGVVDETVPASMRNAVFMGQDLSTLGLDLDSPDPLYPSFTPFPAISGSGSQFDYHDRHTVPEFTLPSAYTVTNVPSLSSRLNAFSDETLFSVFYQHPRDILQELAAMELTARDWRWHKVLRQWLQKDTRESNSGSSLPIVDLASNAPVGAQPVRVGDRTERGVYVFFDAMNWRRERREFILDYEQLDHRHGGQAAVGGAGVSGPAPPGMGSVSLGGPVGGQNLGAVRSQQSAGGSSQIPGA